MQQQVLEEAHHKQENRLAEERDSYKALITDAREELENVFEEVQEILDRVNRLKLKLALPEDDDDRDQIYNTRTRTVDGIQCCPDCGTIAGCCGCFAWTRRRC